MDIIIALIGAIVLAQLIDGRVAFVLVGLIFAGRRIFLYKQKMAEIERLGLTQEEEGVISDLIKSGDRNAAIKHIEEAQNQRRAVLSDMGVDADKIIPEVGREIPWSSIVRQVFRVLDFDRSQTTMDSEDNVIPVNDMSPYGYLLVESPILNQPMRLPITHRDDFRLAASAFDHPQFSEMSKQNELLVTYAPKVKLPGGLAGIWHALHYVVTPRGTLDRYYSVNNDEYMRHPNPEKIFAPFVWSGEVRVGMNFDPKLD